MAGRFEPFELSDLEAIRVQPRHAGLVPIILAHPLVFQHAMVGPWSYTYWLACGRPVACAGITTSGEGWAFLGEDMRRVMVPCSRATRQVHEVYARSVGPVKWHVDRRHPEAVRWAELIGLRPTGEVEPAGEVWKFT